MLYSSTIFFFLLSGIKQTQGQFKLSYCTEFGTNPIQKFEDYYFTHYLDDYYLECTKCEEDPHRSQQLNTCACDKGYFYNGERCQQHQVGIIKQYDFNTNSSNYIQDNFYPIKSPEIVYHPQFQQNVLTFKNKTTGSNIISKFKFQGLQHDDKLFLSLDYFPDTECQLLIGFWTQDSNKHNWITGITEYIGRDYYQRLDSESRLQHFEIVIPYAYHDLPAGINIEDWEGFKNLTEGSKCFIGDITISSSHGPKEFNENPYAILDYPSIMVTSFDHDNYGQSNSSAQFNFDIVEMNKVFGHQNWVNNIYAIYIPERRMKVQVQLFGEQEYNGGSLGKGHGKIIDDSYKGNTTLFYNGQHILFDMNFTSNVTEFILENGIGAFTGPFKNGDQNLGSCFDGCRDYATIEEAMQKCQEEAQCDGVTFTHKYWGGENSQGFKLGYGYQLRKSSPQDNKRRFEYSYRKDTTKQCPLNCKSCDFKLNCVGEIQTCAQQQKNLFFSYNKQIDISCQNKKIELSSYYNIQSRILLQDTEIFYNNNCLKVEVYFGGKQIQEGENLYEQYQLSDDSKILEFNIRNQDLSTYNCTSEIQTSSINWRCPFEYQFYFRGVLQHIIQSKLQVIINTITKSVSDWKLVPQIDVGEFFIEYPKIETELKVCKSQDCSSYYDNAQEIEIVKGDSVFIEQIIKDQSYQQYYLDLYQYYIGSKNDPQVPDLVSKNSQQKGKLILELQINLVLQNQQLTVISILKQTMGRLLDESQEGKQEAIQSSIKLSVVDQDPQPEGNRDDIVLILSILCGVLVLGFIVVGICVWSQCRRKK